MILSKKEKEASDCYTCGGYREVFEIVNNIKEIKPCPDCFEANIYHMDSTASKYPYEYEDLDLCQCQECRH